MKILIACEWSGIVREAFRARGHDVWSCDILPTAQPGQHIQDNVLNHLDGWDMIIAHPPCTFLANSGARWLFEKPGRWGQLYLGVEFFRRFLDAPCPKIAVENPQPHKWATEMIGRRYDQKVQPWMFGDKQRKGLCLWLQGLPPLTPTNIVGPPPKGDKSWEKVWRMPPGPDQAKERGKTFQGFADAMAAQWG